MSVSQILNDYDWCIILDSIEKCGFHITIIE